LSSPIVFAGCPAARLVECLKNHPIWQWVRAFCLLLATISCKTHTI